eukprot:GHRQ01016218.1.p1 GENE.GHRQ01016218.1~~GHRQ01016218.1.p1  ORF type:complete len:134 (-),score=10.62 GHRQ01016218.1:971-1372(-)
MTRTMYSRPLDLSRRGSLSRCLSVSTSAAMMRSSSCLDLHSPIALTSRSSSRKGSLGAFSCCSMLASLTAAPQRQSCAALRCAGVLRRVCCSTTAALLRCAALWGGCCAAIAISVAAQGQRLPKPDRGPAATV